MMLSRTSTAAARRFAASVRRFSTDYVPPPPPPPPPAPKKDQSGALVMGLVGVLAAGAGLAYVYQEPDPRNAATNKPKEAEAALKKAIEDSRPPTTANSVAQAPPPASPAHPATPVLDGTAPTPAPPSPTNPNIPVSKMVVDEAPAKAHTEVVVLKHKGAEEKLTTEADWNKIRERIVDLLDDPEYDDGSWGPVFVRLAWHAAGTYDKNTGKGGSEGALMRFAHQGKWNANEGLALPRARLESVAKEFPQVSHADLWSFAGTVAIEEMGGPEMKWRPGRVDKDQTSEQPLPDGLLPDADGRGKEPAQHVRDVFYRMGFNDQEIVALLGAHALGRCHSDRSGYEGPWTRSPTTFSNTFYQHLLEEQWEPKKMLKGRAWTGPLQYQDKKDEIMMLPTDLALVQDAKFRKYVEEYAKDEDKFMKDFAKAWVKLQENGVKKFQKSWWWPF